MQSIKTLSAALSGFFLALGASFALKQAGIFEDFSQFGEPEQAESKVSTEPPSEQSPIARPASGTKEVVSGTTDPVPDRSSNESDAAVSLDFEALFPKSGNCAGEGIWSTGMDRYSGQVPLANQGCFALALTHNATQPQRIYLIMVSGTASKKALLSDNCIPGGLQSNILKPGEVMEFPKGLDGTLGILPVDAAADSEFIMAVSIPASLSTDMRDRLNSLPSLCRPSPRSDGVASLDQDLRTLVNGSSGVMLSRLQLN